MQPSWRHLTAKRQPRSSCCVHPWTTTSKPSSCSLKQTSRQPWLACALRHKKRRRRLVRGCGTNASASCATLPCRLRPSDRPSTKRGLVRLGHLKPAWVRRQRKPPPGPPTCCQRCKAPARRQAPAHAARRRWRGSRQRQRQRRNGWPRSKQKSRLGRRQQRKSVLRRRASKLPASQLRKWSGCWLTSVPRNKLRCRPPLVTKPLSLA